MERLPLHAKVVGRLEWEKARLEVLDHLIDIFDEARRPFTDSQMLEEACKKAHAEGIPLTVAQDARITEQDLGVLLEADLVYQIDESTVKASVDVFTVVEEEKGRRRLICAPRLNSILTTVPSTTLPGGDELRDAVTAETAICVDFPWWYGQMELDAEVHAFYTFRFRGNTYALKTVPTGARSLPALAQVLTQSIAERAALDCEVITQTYIDNVRFAGCRRDVIKAHDNFVCRCLRLGVTLDEGLVATPVERYVFLGVCYDHDAETVELTSKFLNKLQHLLQVVFNPEATMRQFLRCLGMLVYGSRIMALPLDTYYHTLKFARRRARTELDGQACVWACVTVQIRAWTGVLVAAAPTVVSLNQPPQLVVYSDASTSGYGSMCIDERGRISTLAGKWSVDEHISVLESRALEYAVAGLPKASRPTSVLFRVDNTTTLALAQKQRSKIWTLNCIAGRLAESLKKRGYIAQFEYVNTKENLADGLSRGICRSTFIECARAQHPH